MSNPTIDALRIALQAADSKCRNIRHDLDQAEQERHHAWHQLSYAEFADAEESKETDG